MTATRIDASKLAQNSEPFSFNDQQKNSLFAQLKQQRGILSHSDISSLCQQFQVSQLELLKACVPVASLFSVAPISKFYVGAIAVGLNKQGETIFYFGANFDFSHQALSAN